MCNIFNSVIQDNEGFEILYGYMNESKFEKGFFLDTNTTTFYYYIIGFRKSDYRLILIQVDSNLEEHSLPIEIDMDSIVNVSYYPKLCQVCLKYRKDYGSYGEILNIKDTHSKTLYGPKNIYQRKERESFLDYLENFRKNLEQKGYKLDKWKR